MTNAAPPDPYSDEIYFARPDVQAYLAEQAARNALPRDEFLRAMGLKPSDLIPPPISTVPGFYANTPAPPPPDEALGFDVVYGLPQTAACPGPTGPAAPEAAYPAPAPTTANTVREAVFQILDHTRTLGIYTGLPGGQQTVREVVQTRPLTERCSLGPLASEVQPANLKIRNQRNACSGKKCPHCVEFALVRDTTRALQLWGAPEKVWRRRFTEAEWKNSRAVKALKSDHDLYVAVTNGDFRVMLSPEPIPGGDEVPALGAFLEAVLGAPARGRRFNWAQKEVRKDRDAAIRTLAREGKPEREWTKVASFHTLDSVRARYDLALQNAERWSTEHGRRGAPFSTAETKTISVDAVPRAVAVVDALRLERREEISEMNERRSATVQWDHLPEDHPYKRLARAAMA